MFDSLFPRVTTPHSLFGRPRVEIPLPRPPQNSAAEWNRLVVPVSGRPAGTRARRWGQCRARRG